MRILAFDLECTNLSGMIGRILCCSFKPIVWGADKEEYPPYTFRGDDKKYRVNGDVADDSKLAIAIRDELEDADMLIAHNGKLFDSKFLNARLFKAAVRPRQPRFFLDTMWTVRTHLRMSSKLANIQQFAGLEDEKTPISWDSWQRGAAFDTKAMDEIVKHCEQDVLVLEQAYWRLLPYQRTLQRA